MTRHPARVLADAEKNLLSAQRHLRKRKHKKLIKKSRQLINQVLRWE
jgi:hypothetical protein